MHVQKEEKLNLFQKQDTNIAGRKQLLIMELSLLIVKDVDIINSRNYIYICILSFKLNENKFIMTYIIKYVAPYHTNDFNETLKTCFCCGQEFPEINSVHFVTFYLCDTCFKFEKSYGKNIYRKIIDDKVFICCDHPNSNAIRKLVYRYY